MTCQDLGLAEGIPSSSIPSLNYDVKCAIPLTNGTYCLPQRCSIAVVESDISVPILLQDDRYQNMTLVQFIAWDPDVDLKNLFAGDTVCVGAPGGIYTPSSTTVSAAYPTSFTTTATPSPPTATDTISNCGLYYTVQEGDICDDLTIRFGLTLSQLIAMNPSLDEACSNLLYGMDYCVAPVNGTNITPPITSTATPTSTSGDDGGTTSTTVAAPTATRTGTTESCYDWYLAVSRDSCWSIYTSYRITFEQFCDWNAVIDAECSNLWPDHAYWVSGP